MKPSSLSVGRSCVFAASLLVCRIAAADTVVNFGTVTQIDNVSDIDLTGEMTHAINFSANDPALTINGVIFTPDTAAPPGAIFVGPNNVTPWQTKPEFGTDPDNNNFERVLEDIRWANTGAGQVIEAHLPVTTGQTYKMQILFYGNHAEDRKWDIEVEGTLAVDEVSSLGANVGGANPPYATNAAIVYTTTLTAGDGSLDVRFVGDLPGSNNDGATDRNPIWQGITVEHIVGDSDGDGMTDAWETLYFGNLTRNGTGDFDADGLTDLDEFNRDTKPNNVDTDGDTLNDGAEVNTHLTNPKLADTDADGLTDQVEINTRHTDPTRADTDLDGLNDGAEVAALTDPLKADSDGDSYYDGLEVARATNPLSASSFPLFTPEVKAITGGDVGDGLDFDGTFIAAVRFGVTGGVGTWSVRDADFVPFDTFVGLTQNAVNQADNWLLPTYATSPTATADDIALGEVVDSIRYGSPIVNITVPGLTVGKAYKVQLLFGEQCCNNRGFDVYIENALVANEFAPGPVQGGASAAPARTGAVVAAFVASDTTLDVRLDFTTITTAGLTDSNTIINALTVEELPPLPDTDGDSLPDIWEVANFGNTSQPAAGDPDADGLTNLGEYQHNTNPNDADSDDDGLNDGPEINTHLTDPLKADTDGDGLSDGAEINTHTTNPKNPDTDNDGYSDGAEIIGGSNPKNAASYPFGYTEAKGFTGGDAGEGLDLDGTFLYAINIGTNGAAGQVRDANFTDDAVAGATWTAVNEIGAWNTPAYGDTPNDDGIEMVIQSIRWSAAPTPVTASLTGLTIGRPYKLQLLFGEQCCNRGFDVLVNGSQILDDFSPRTHQGGIANPSRGAVVVHEFYAKSATLDIMLSGSGVTDPTLTDHNPTLSGITLESLPPFPDTDADTLPDYWEFNNFGNLSQNATGDPDADGLTNAAEFQGNSDPDDADSDDDGINDGPEINTHHTDPKNPDTDGDGLTDGAEVNTRLTDPKNPDSDFDTLTDGAEVNTLLTNPKSIDTDNDGFNDPTEVLNGTSPTDASSKPGATHIARVLGGDTQAEGLDLDGSFLYAFNVGTPGAAGPVRDANFTDDLQAGIAWIAANEIPLWDQVNFGDTQNDNNLEFVFQSIRWNAAPNTVMLSLDGLTVGASYKLQLLFGEQCCPARGFDLNVEGVTVINDFNTADAQVAPNHPYAGGAMVHSFIATDTTLDIELNGNTTNFGDKNPILSGVTLESLGGASAGTFAISSIVRTPTPGGATVVLNFRGTAGKSYSVDFSTNLATWSEVTDAVVAGAGGAGTYTDTSAARTNVLRGYYRMRDPVLKPTP